MGEVTTEQTYVVSVSGRTYFNIVLPAMAGESENVMVALDLPSPVVTRAGRGVRARFGDLSYIQAMRLGDFCKTAGDAWLIENDYSAAGSILARVFIKDGARVHAQVEEQRQALVDMRRDR